MILNILRSIVQHGTAPPEGCAEIDVANADAIERIARVYFGSDFPDGRAAEKLVVGPYGSGKTHFLRQLMERARKEHCVTSECNLTPATDLTNPLFLYSQFAKNIRVPEGTDRTGVEKLLETSIERMRSHFDVLKGGADKALDAWIEQAEIEASQERSVGRQVRRALRLLKVSDRDGAEPSLRWLEGEVDNAGVAKAINEKKLSAAEQRTFGLNALPSIMRFVRHAGWHGTVVAFDEAEQAMNQPKKKQKQILSNIRVAVDATTRNQGVGYLIAYGITPDILAGLTDYPALQQRFSAPKDRGFFDGTSEANTRAAVLDLERRLDADRHIRAFGRRLVDLLYLECGDTVTQPRGDAERAVDKIADGILASTAGASAFREMAKATAAHLLTLLPEVSPPSSRTREREV